MVLANILANPLKLLAPALSNHVRPGGRLVLSGILSTQADKVARCYAEWIELGRFKETCGWVALEGIRGATSIERGAAAAERS